MPPKVPAATSKQSSQVKSPIPLRKFGLAWESYLTYDGEITGIESSTNLRDWKVEASWPLVVVSNTWRDTNPAAEAKFYRAFNE